MIKASVEKVYVVKKGDKRFVIELCRSSDGKLFVVPVFTLKHVYETEGGEKKEWEYDVKGAEEIEYMALPKHIREALSKVDL